MASQTDIVNLALTHLGSWSIGSLAENSESARRASLLWGPTVDEVLRDYPWAFATMIKPLALINETVIGWTYLYAYPAKCLRVRKVLNQVVGLAALPGLSGIAGIPDWDVSDEARNLKREVAEPFEEMMAPTSGAKAIASNLAGAYAAFTYQVLDTSMWDAKFVKAFSFKMAAELCQHLVGNPDNLRVSLEGKYAALIGDGGRLNAAEGNDAAKTKSSIYDAR